MIQAGVYTCKAVNALGHGEASVRLNVIYAPQCRLRKALDDDGQLVLRCDVSAHPANVTYYWYHNDEPLTTVIDATLHFRSVTPPSISRHKNITWATSTMGMGCMFYIAMSHGSLPKKNKANH